MKYPVNEVSPQEQALVLVSKKRNPNLWGTGYDFEEKQAIDIWNWAEKHSKIAVQTVQKTVEARRRMI